MKNSRNASSLKLSTAAAAVIGTLGLFVVNAQAQQRVGSDGRARDANNLVGSGGLNSGSGAPLSINTVNNAIVNGDVSGGKAFRGNLGFEDPTAFRGSLAGQGVSNFIASSSGVTTSGVLTNNANQTRIYLGDNRGVNAPSNFVSLGSNGGYVQAPQLNAASSDPRLGNPGAISTSLGSQSIYAPAGTEGGGARSSYVTASPLYGVKGLGAAQAATGSTNFGQSAAINGAPLNSLLDDSAATRLQALNEGINTDLTPGSISAASNNQFASPSSIGQQQGLPPNGAGNSVLTANLATGSQQSPNNANGTSDNNAINQSPLNSNQNGNQQVNGGSLDTGNGLNGRTNDRALNGAIPAGSAVTANAGSQRLGGSVNTGEDIQTNILNNRASQQQGSAYMQMKRRLQTQNGGTQLTVGQRNMLQQASLTDLRNAQKKANDSASAKGGDSSKTNINSGRNASGFSSPGIPSAPDKSGGSAVSPTGALVPQQIAPVKSQPSNLVVPSFAREESDKPTAALLAKAEDLMKQGKFSSALEQYDQVEHISPNNPFALLGRANAELGATSYGLAEQHLRRAFSSDQALLMAKYDLSAFLGNDRLQYLIKDLKEIAQANPNEARPVFLLSYICYNTNKDRAAANYLDLAQKREGKPDAFFKLLQQRWDLPDVTNTNDNELNK